MSEQDTQASLEGQARERQIISARIVHEAVRKEGEEELARPASALAWSGFAAGLAMGFSLIGEGLLQARLVDEPWRPLVSKLGYALGFIIVTLGRQQLYTENTLTAVIPALEQRRLAAWAGVLRLWGIVLAANLVGALAVAAFAETDAFRPEFRDAFAAIGEDAMMGGAWTHFLRAIPAGWLIALIVWLGPAVPSSRLWITLLLAYVVGIGGFAHIIAGAVETIYLVLIGQLAVGRLVLDFLLPVLLGNTAGGVLIVAAVNHAQTKSKV
ncbi:MAG TPA: formate/nitrite transporter family protein [Gammaproteobacteria bacterium]|nr:formate/nitrite transporter family protein [Gammaproteobacteria bacterium]